MKRAPTREILWLFISTRLLLVMVTYFGYILLTAPKYSSTGVDVAALLTSWNHWDALNYLRIAQHGYESIYDLAFFPLFPLLISGFAFLLGSWSYLTVGTILSNVAFLGAMFILYQLAVDAGGDQVARRTLLYLCIFPTSFYFFAAYNESLFLLLASGTFLAIRRQHWWIAGILGFLAALTRSAGVLLLVPYLLEIWLARKTLLTSLRRYLFTLLPGVLMPLGTAAYGLYCWIAFGNPLAFVTVQSHWGRQTTWPWQGIWQALSELFWNQPFGSFYEAHIILDLIATISFIALIILGWRTLRLSYSIWLIIVFLFIMLSPTIHQHDALTSNQRFVLEMFPAFITLAMLGIQHPRLHQALLMIFPVLLAVLSVLFVMNRWMV